MRRTLGQSLALAAFWAAAVTGCGSDAGTASDPATDPASSSTRSSSSSAGGLDFDEVALVSQTAAGGRVSPEPVPLDGAAAVSAFTDRFRSPGLGRRVARAVRRADLPPGRALLGAVVAVGCDVPPGVRVEDSGAGPEITALPVESPKQECFAPVTTVAVVSVPADTLRTG
jgi:hypothetical protein